MPPNYIGSSSVDRVLNENYYGSVRSKRYMTIWLSELKLHPELFSAVIVSYHDTRSNATYKELQIQRIFNVAKSDLFINRAYAAKNGCFGMEVTSEEKVESNKKTSNTLNNKTPEEKALKKLKELNTKANKTSEENSITGKKISDAYNNRTPEEKAVTSKKLSDAMINRLPFLSIIESKRTYLKCTISLRFKEFKQWY
jgi:hypothetical protein